MQFLTTYQGKGIEATQYAFTQGRENQTSLKALKACWYINRCQGDLLDLVFDRMQFPTFCKQLKTR